MTTTHYVTKDGSYIGGFGDGADPPPESIEVRIPPDHGEQLWMGGKWRPILPTQADQEASRRAAYAEEADPLFFMVQRGEATMKDWLAKIEEIKARFPYPAE